MGILPDEIGGGWGIHTYDKISKMDSVHRYYYFSRRHDFIPYIWRKKSKTTQQSYKKGVA